MEIMLIWRQQYVEVADRQDIINALEGPLLSTEDVCRWIYFDSILSFIFFDIKTRPVSLAMSKKIEIR